MGRRGSREGRQIIKNNAFNFDQFIDKSTIVDHMINMTDGREKMVSKAQARRQAKLLQERTRRQAELLSTPAGWHTKVHGSFGDVFKIFLTCADDGKGGDITNGGAPLPTFNEWINRAQSHDFHDLA